LLRFCCLEGPPSNKRQKHRCCHNTFIRWQHRLSTAMLFGFPSPMFCYQRSVHVG